MGKMDFEYCVIGSRVNKMYVGFVNSACCIILLAVGLLIADQLTGYTDTHYIQVANLIKFFKSIA